MCLLPKNIQKNPSHFNCSMWSLTVINHMSNHTSDFTEHVNNISFVYKTIWTKVQKGRGEVKIVSKNFKPEILIQCCYYWYIYSLGCNSSYCWLSVRALYHCQLQKSNLDTGRVPYLFSCRQWYFQVIWLDTCCNICYGCEHVRKLIQ